MRCLLWDSLTGRSMQTQSTYFSLYIELGMALVFCMFPHNNAVQMLQVLESDRYGDNTLRHSHCCKRGNILGEGVAPSCVAVHGFQNTAASCKGYFEIGLCNIASFVMWQWIDRRIPNAVTHIGKEAFRLKFASAQKTPIEWRREVRSWESFTREKHVSVHQRGHKFVYAPA